MVEKEKFHCHEAPDSVATEEFCINRCDSTQRGVKAECPESIRLSLDDIKLLEEFQDIRKLGKRLGHKPQHRTTQPAKGRWGRRKTKI